VVACGADADLIAGPDPSRSDDSGVDARAGRRAEAGDGDTVAPGQGAEHLRIARVLAVGEGRHGTAHGGLEDLQADLAADGHLPANPVVLGVAAQPGRGQDQVGAEHPGARCRAGRAGDGGQGRGRDEVNRGVVHEAVAGRLLGKLEWLESYLSAHTVGEHFIGDRPVNRAAGLTPLAQLHRAANEPGQHLIGTRLAGPHRRAVRQRDRHRTGRICPGGVAAVFGSQLQQGPPQPGLLGAGDLAGLPVDQSPASVTRQAGCTHLRLLDAGAEHGLDRVAEDRFN
jgi:hypothetical protein